MMSSGCCFPDEWLWVGGIVFTDEAIDGGLEIDEGMEDTVLEPAPRAFGKEALDGIEPRTRGWREVESRAWRTVEPGADLVLLAPRQLGSIRNFVLWAIVMKKKGASYGNREGTIGPAVGEGRDPETVFTQDGLLDELKKGLSERVLNAELDAHLDAETADGKTNRHNGRSQKTVLTGTSKVTLDIPRDRAGTFDPQLIAKYQRRFPDFDEKIISMYARGMTVREIRGHLQELYGIEVSPDLISTVTDAVLEAVGEWQNRPLDACYAIAFFDAIRVKIRDEGFVRNKAVYIAIAILPDGTKEIPGLWIEQTEGAKLAARHE